MFPTRQLKHLWIAFAVQAAGRLLDLRWHLTHDEFEGTAQQFEAHWLLWLGVIATLVVAIQILRSGEAGVRGPATAVAASCVYIPVSAWHFVEHAAGNDPQLAHLILGLSQLGILAGVIIATVDQRRSSLRALRTSDG